MYSIISFAAETDCCSLHVRSPFITNDTVTCNIICTNTTTLNIRYNN